MRNSRLFIKLSGDYKEVDLYDNLTIPINYSVSEVRDISKRSTNYSLDFDLPNTESNAKLFDHIYKIESFDTSIEMLRKYECVLQVNDTTVFEGYFQLKKVVTDDLKRVTYKGIFYSSVKDFVETLGNTTLRGNSNAADDLDFSEYSVTAANMNLTKFKTMLNSYGTDKTGWGLTLIDKTNKASENFSSNRQDWYADELTPYLFVKEIWDKIFEQAGYSYESDFLTGAAVPYGYPDFTSLIYPYPNNNKKLGDSDNWQKITAGGSFDWTRGYYDMFLPSEWVFANSGNYIDFPSAFSLTNHNMPDDRTHWQFTAPYTSSYHVKFKIPISLKCELHSYNYTDEQWLPQYTGAVTCGDTSKEFIMWTRLGKIHGGTTTYITSWGNYKNFESTYNTGADGRLLLESQEVSYEGDIRLEAGDKLFLSTAIQMEVAYYDQTWERWYSYLMYRGVGGWVSVFPYPAIVEMTQSAGVEIWSVTQNEYFGEGLPFNPTLVLNPKTKKWDFVNSIIKMFNLYIEDIGDRKFRIEPRDLYYTTSVKRDFTDKVDTSSMSFTRVDTYIYSDVNFKFAQDKDVMTEAYNGTYQLPYGEYVLEGALSSGKDSVEIKPVFGASMCGVVNAQTSVLQCPKMYAFKANSDVVNVDKVYSDRIFYIWQNAMANNASVNNTIRIKSRYSTSSQTQTTYYCADILNAGYGTDTQSLTWWNSEEYLENLGDGTVSNGNLYNRFYSKMLSELNDPEARILSCRMYLDATDIRNIRLSDTIVVNKVEYRINSIKQWEGYSKPTEVELIKIVRPTSSYTPSRGNVFLTSRLESNAELNIMKGATETEDGLAGWVPTPEAGDENKFLRGDGTWQTVGGGSEYTGVEPIDVTGTEISLNVGGGLEVEEHGSLQVNTDHTTIGINNSGAIYAKIPDIKVRHINYVDDVFDSKDFNYLDIDGNKDMTIIVRDYNSQDNMYTFRYFRLDTSNPQEESLYIFESDKEYLTYRDDNTWSIARKPFDVQRIRVGNVYVSPIEGIITLAEGSNVSLSSSGSTITISASGGGGTSGIENITVGGITVSPTSGSVSLTAGSNITLTPNGSDITIAADAGVTKMQIGSTDISPVSGAIKLVAGSNVTLSSSSNEITIAAASQSTFVGHIYYEDGVFQSKDFVYSDLGDDCVIVVAYEYTDDSCTRYDYLRPIASTEYTNDGVFILEGETYHLEYTSGDTFNLTFRKAVNAVAVDGTELDTYDLIGLASGDDVELTTGNSLGAPLVTIDLTATAKNAISDFVDTQDDAYIDYTLVAGTPAPTGAWIDQCTYTTKNTYNSTTGEGRFYLKPNIWIGGNSDAASTPFPQSTTLKTIDFRYSCIKDIGRRAFYNCTALERVYFGAVMLSLGRQCFMNCTSLATLSATAAITTIGSGAFYGCTALTTLDMASSWNVETIGNSAFASCTGLTTVTISTNTTKVSPQIFYGCTALTTVTFPSVAGFDTIPQYMFYGCTALTSLTIPAPIAHIGRRAFYNTNQVVTLSLPETLVSVEYEAFRAIKSNVVVTCNALIPPYCADYAFGVDASGMTKPTSGNRVLKVPANSLPYYKALDSTYGVVSGWALQFKDSNIQAIS